MYSFLRTPRWIAALTTVFVIVLVFLSLGRWQLQRHNEVKLDNAIGASRLGEDPLPLGQVMGAVGDSIDSLEYRRVTAIGTFDAAEEVLVRNQVDDGLAGFHVVTPFTFETGTILVNRGWVPLVFDTPPIDAAPPPTGEVEIELILRSSQERPSIGRVEPEGRLDVINRIDLERLSEQVDGLAPVWGQLVDVGEVGNTRGDLPRPVSIPTFADNGPHFAYAIQWFLFAAIATLGPVFLIRSSASKQSSRRQES